jgi:hypothetical protein
MLGYNESQILHRITEPGFGLPYQKRQITKEKSEIVELIKQSMNKTAERVAKVIAANNKKIEEDLRKAGVTIKNEGLPSN